MVDSSSVQKKFFDLRQNLVKVRSAPGERSAKKVKEKYREFGGYLGSIVASRAIILGPFERMKIVMQVDSLAKYANATSDRPKNIYDLCSKINQNQGIFAFYRGTHALIYKLCVQYGARFVVFDHFLGSKSVENNSGTLYA